MKSRYLGPVKELHPNQSRLLELLRQNIDAPLTVRELQEELGASSPSVVHHHIQQLVKNGYLKRNPSNPRDYQIPGDPEKPVVYINQYGLAECGPHGSILDGNPTDRIPIASRLLKFPAVEAFIVTASGKSMVPKIHPGDLLIAQKQASASNGEIVVCVNGSEAIVKKFYQESKGEAVILHSINADFPPFVAADDFRIEGVVRSILSYN